MSINTTLTQISNSNPATLLVDQDSCQPSSPVKINTGNAQSSTSTNEKIEALATASLSSSSSSFSLQSSSASNLLTLQQALLPAASQEQIEIIELEKAFKELEKLPKQVVDGHTYYIYGNSSFEKAKIRCFAEVHDIPSLDKKKWQLLKNNATKDDALLLESYSHETVVTQAIMEKSDETLLNPQIKDLIFDVVNTIPTYGWEPKRNNDWLQNENIHQEIRSLENVLTALEKDYVALIYDFDTPAEYELSRENYLAIITLKEILDGETLIELLEIRNIENDDLRKIKTLKLLEKIRSTLLQKKDALVDTTALWIKQNRILRNSQLAKKITSSNAKSLYVVAGASHFPSPFSLNQHEYAKSLEDIQKALHSRPHCILIPDEVVGFYKSKLQLLREEEFVKKQNTLHKPSPLLTISALGTEHHIFNEQDLKELYAKINTANCKKYDSLLKEMQLLNSSLRRYEKQFFETSKPVLHKIAALQDSLQPNLLDRAHLACRDKIINLDMANSTDFSPIQTVIEEFLQSDPNSLICEGGQYALLFSSFFTSDAFLETNSLRILFAAAQYSVHKKAPSDNILDSFYVYMEISKERLGLAQKSIDFIYQKQQEQLAKLL